MRVVFLMSLIGCQAMVHAAPDSKDSSDAGYRYGRASPGGIGKFYEDREISHVMGHLGASWLERDSRETEEKPSVLLRELGIGEDTVIADIGAGTGYFAFPMAKRASKGKVFAVDIQPEMLAKIRARSEATGITNVTPIQGSPQSPNLPDDTVDLALMVDAYHEFSHPYEMMSALYRAMKSGGRVVLVEYRGEDPAIAIKRLHKMTEAQVKRELAKVGFKHVRTSSALPVQHILVFEKPLDL